MSFASIEFIVFLPVVFFLYYIVPINKRWIVLLTSSYVFYAFAGIQYIAVLVYITVLAFASGAFLYRSKNIKGIHIAIATVLVIAPLIIFKYTGFIARNINVIISAFGSAQKLSTMELALPIGISFYTFSALSYVIDVSQKKYEPFDNFFHFASGVSFFPCLVSGPIERQNKLVPQIIRGNAFNYSMATYGLKQIAWGLFEKIVIADNLAVYVDNVFSNVKSFQGAPLLAGSLLFTIQIYCDFAGYSDIAIGVAKLFGIELTKNFHSPYLSKSMQEFWRRWHISLSSWFRDYVYIPLGGNRKGNIRKNINIIVTMVVSGVWHGAAWTFIAWGWIHGVVQAVENLVGYGKNKKTDNNKFVNLIKVLLVIAISNTLWVFFRAASFADAMYLLSHMFAGITNVRSYMNGLEAIGLHKVVLVQILFELLILFFYDYASLKTDVIKIISSKSLIVRWGIYCLFLLVVVQLAYKGGSVNFVYAGF